MTHEQEHEIDAFIWENQSWANLFNDTPPNPGGEKVVLMAKLKEEEKEEAKMENGKGKGKKRGRGATTKKKGKKENNGEKKEAGEEPSAHEIHIWTERERRKKMRTMFSNLHCMLPQLPSKADKSTIIDEAVNYVKTLESTLQRLQKQKLERLQGVGPSNSLPFEPSVAATSTIALLSTRETFMADQVSSMNNTTNNTNPNNNAINNPGTSTVLSASASHLPVIIQTWASSNVVLNITGNDAQFAVYAPKKHGLFTNICGVFEKYKLEVISAHISSDADRCVYMIQVRMGNGATDQFPESVTIEEIYKQAATDIMLWESKEAKELQMDDLPDDIISYILSRLNVRDATRALTSLSKRWRHLLSRLTTLNFDASETLILQVLDEKQISCQIKHLSKYANWINHVLSLNSAPSINEFRLCWVLLAETAYFAPDIDSWFKFAASKRVKKLELDFILHSTAKRSFYGDRYALRYDFLNAYIDSGLYLFTSLCLKSVNIEGKLVDSILSHCQYMEQIELVDSPVLQLTRLKVTNSFRRLKHFALRNCAGIKELEIHALDVFSLKVECHHRNPLKLLNEDNDDAVLLEFDSSNYNDRTTPIFSIDIDYYVQLQGTNHHHHHHPSTVKCVSALKMKTLCLKGVKVSGGVLECLLSRFSLLEKLIVVCSLDLVSLKVTEESSKSLQHLQIHSSKNMRELEIHAPYLTTLDLSIDELKVDVTYGSVPSLVNVCFGRITHVSFSKFNQIRNISAQLTKLSLRTANFCKRLDTFPTFDNVRYLELIVEVQHQKNLLPVICFAEKCQLLHEFKLQIIWYGVNCQCYALRFKSYDIEQKLKEKKFAFEGQKLSRSTLPKLRKFELIGAFHHKCRVAEYEYPLVLCIIKKAIRLEKFIFNVTGSTAWEFPGLLSSIKETQMVAAQQLSKDIPPEVDMEIITIDDNLLP